MPSRIKLESEKYWVEKVNAQIAECKRSRNRKALSDLSTFVMGLAAIGLVVFFLPACLPAIQDQVNTIDWSQGLSEALPFKF